MNNESWSEKIFLQTGDIEDYKLYIRADIAAERERKLIKTTKLCIHDDEPIGNIYKQCGLEPLK